MKGNEKRAKDKNRQLRIKESKLSKHLNFAGNQKKEKPLLISLLSFILARIAKVTKHKEVNTLMHCWFEWKCLTFFQKQFGNINTKLTWMYPLVANQRNNYSWNFFICIIISLYIFPSLCDSKIMVVNYFINKWSYKIN